MGFICVYHAFNFHSRSASPADGGAQGMGKSSDEHSEETVKNPAEETKEQQVHG